MALQNIQLPGYRPRKPSTMEQIALGVDMASKVLGTGLNAYKLFKVDIPEANAKTQEAQAKTQTANQGLADNYMEANPGEVGHHIPGGDPEKTYVNRQQSQWDASTNLHQTVSNDKALAARMKQDKEDDVALDHINNAMNIELKSGRLSPIGKAQVNVFQAQRLKTLSDQFKQDPNKMPLTGPNSISELAIGINSLLAPGVGSEGARESLIPHTAQGKFSTLEQFLTSRPQGAELQDFYRNFNETIDRETKVNQKQIDNYKETIKKVFGLQSFSKRQPEKFDQAINAWLDAGKISTDDISSGNAVIAPGNTPPSGKIHVSNPKTGEQFYIDPQHLNDAQKEGFQQIK